MASSTCRSLQIRCQRKGDRIISRFFFNLISLHAFLLDGPFHFFFVIVVVVFFYFLTLFYTVSWNKVFCGNDAPLQNGVVVVVNDFWTNALTSNVLNFISENTCFSCIKGNQHFQRSCSWHLQLQWYVLWLTDEVTKFKKRQQRLVKKWTYILPTNLAILLSHVLSFSLSKYLETEYGTQR